MSEPETLLERLRGNASQWAPLMREAADEIEKLREFVEFAGRHLGSDWPDHCREIVQRARSIPLERPSSDDE